MSIRRLLGSVLLFATTANGGFAFAEVLRAVDVIGPTDVDWLALARAQRKIRSDGADAIRFVWATPPDANYSEIRRGLWLAALHGITDQTSPHERTRQLMADEMKLMRRRLNTPFAIDVGIRDVDAADRLLRLLVRKQTSCQLLGTNETCRLPVILRCRQSEVLSEQSGIAFTSLEMAAKFTQSSQMDNGIVFEETGHVATNVFLRRFRDGSATIVNLSNDMRPNLCYRIGSSRTEFVLAPADVVHIRNRDSILSLCDKGELFLSELWHISFSGGKPARLVRSDLLPSVVSETYTGTIRYRTVVCIPSGTEDLFLHLDTAGAETEVLIDGRSLGIRSWPPYDWPIPIGFRDMSLPLEIRVEKLAQDEYLQTTPNWFRKR